jgi:hypothetical protein
MLAQLYFQHPKIFDARSEPVGSDLPPGWFALVDRLFADIESGLSPSKVSSLTVTQIKEKWGGLRVYFNVDGDCHDMIEDLVEAASLKSEEICMRCGAPGTRCCGRLGVFTLCPSCRTPEMIADGTKTRVCRVGPLH